MLAAGGWGGRAPSISWKGWGWRWRSGWRWGRLSRWTAIAGSASVAADPRSAAVRGAGRAGHGEEFCRNFQTSRFESCEVPEKFVTFVSGLFIGIMSVSEEASWFLGWIVVNNSRGEKGWRVESVLS